ncbi:hypothetical protein DNX69_09150 [Rhodopseudomonas palustris]|uniref:Porin n=1 Tax=Rhodopseudomonas palustris TaxID=1076 RepID=A0A323UIF3_RHOPL|nr:hypothetical protein [Rhodopseudomonas palustris]PZA12171.1 hypothetical protein DNX69_09150 [Rhodopseudomonas palustris]
MKYMLIVLAVLLPVSAGAEPRKSAVPKALAETSAPAPRAPGSGRNPCSAFGPGFVQLEGSSTCVKLGGSISVGAGVRR